MKPLETLETLANPVSFPALRTPSHTCLLFRFVFQAYLSMSRPRPDSPQGDSDYRRILDDDGFPVSPVTLDEVGVFNDESERIRFEDEDDHVTPLHLHSVRSPTARPRRRQAPLNGLNYLNVVAYAVHLFASWGIGVFGLDGLVDTRWEIQRRYASLITPAHWSSLFIWAPILILEAVFTIAQLFPYYRTRPIVQVRNVSLSKYVHPYMHPYVHPYMHAYIHSWTPLKLTAPQLPFPTHMIHVNSPSRVHDTISFTYPSCKLHGPSSSPSNYSSFRSWLFSARSLPWWLFYSLNTITRSEEKTEKY